MKIETIYPNLTSAKEIQEIWNEQTDSDLSVLIYSIKEDTQYRAVTIGQDGRRIYPKNKEKKHKPFCKIMMYGNRVIHFSDTRTVGITLNHLYSNKKFMKRRTRRPDTKLLV